MSKTERLIYGAAQCWELYQRYPDDPQFELMARDAVEDILIYRVDESPTDYFLAAPLDSSIVNYAKRD